MWLLTSSVAALRSIAGTIRSVSVSEAGTTEPVAGTAGDLGVGTAGLVSDGSGTGPGPVGPNGQPSAVGGPVGNPDGNRGGVSGGSERARNWGEWHVKLRRRAWNFYRRVEGTELLTNGTIGLNPNGAQCVNVANEWFRLNGATAIGGNADAFVGASTGAFQWHALAANERPHVGDVLVWGASADMPDGHVSLCLDGAQDPLKSLDENYPLGSLVHVQDHLLSGIAGVIRLKG
jgi:hypothetical protein